MVVPRKRARRSMTVIMYLAGLSQSCVVNTASQPILRERMTRNLQLHGLGARTQEAYLRAVRQLAAFYRPTPNQFNEEQLCEYFLRLKNHSTYSKSRLFMILLHGLCQDFRKAKNSFALLWRAKQGDQAIGN